MELHKIRYFFTVIEHGNLSSAAQSLRVSQPTLSRQIRAIEEEYNTALFVRGGRGMMLTEAGKQLHDGLQSIERQLRLLKTNVAAVSIEPTGEVAFGVPPSPRKLIAVPLIKQYNAAYPRVVVRLVEETSGQLRDLVASGILDVAVTNTLEPTHGIASQIIGRERLVLVGPYGAKLTMRKDTPITDAGKSPLDPDGASKQPAPSGGKRARATWPAGHRLCGGKHIAAHDGFGDCWSWLLRPSDVWRPRSGESEARLRQSDS